MSHIRIFATLAIALAIAASAACSNKAMPMSAALSGREATASVTGSVQSRSGITFRPAPPITLSLNTSVNVAVREGGYSGSFKLSGCSAKRPAHCAPVLYGFACYENSAPHDINSISATMHKGSTTMALSNQAAGTHSPAIRCHFKIKDAFGNSAIYTVMSP